MLVYPKLTLSNLHVETSTLLAPFSPPIFFPFVVTLVCTSSSGT